MGSRLTGSDISGIDNFSYHTILDGYVIEIPLMQQMIVFGELLIEGELVLIEDAQLVLL